MSVPYVFASFPNGTAIPLSYLDSNFSYLTSSPTFSGNVTITGTLGVGGAVTFNSTLSVTDAVTLGAQQTTQGSLILANTAAGAYPTTIKSSNSASVAWTMTLPVSAGSSGYILTTNGSGVTSWTNPTALGIDLDVGSTAITSGTSGRVLYDNAGVLGEKSVTGSGDAVLAISPTLVTPVLGTPSSGTLSSCTGLPISTGVSGLGTSVATALQVNVGTAGSFLVNGGVLGTPSSGTLSGCSGLPVSTGISGLGANVATFLATPSSANLAAALTDETGSGSAVFSTAPTLTGAVLEAGTNSVAPLKLTSGTNLSAAAAGAVEYDGTVFTATSDANFKRGTIPITNYASGTGTTLGTNTEATLVALLPAANDTITLAIGTYYLDASFIITRGASTTSATARLNILGSGNAAGTFSGMSISAPTSGGASANFSFDAVNINTSNVLTAASTTSGGVYQLAVRGVLKITSAGTIIPQYNLSANINGAGTVAKVYGFILQQLDSQSAAAAGPSGTGWG